MQVGRWTIGRDLKIETSPAKEKVFDILGGFLDFGSNKLSGDKSISNKILQANRGWVYRNNDVIAQEVSKLEFELYTIGLSGGEIVYNEVTSHPLLDLLDKPNPETVKTDFVYITQSHKKLAGDAFWLKIRDNTGKVTSLRTLPPDKIILNLQPPTRKDPTVIGSYQYKDVIAGEKIDVEYKPRDIIHFKKPNPNNPFRGLGAVEAAADTIDLDGLTNETTKKFFQNGAITNFVLSTENKITDDQLKRLKAEMRAQYGGASKAYQTMILGGGLKPVDVSYSNKDQEFLGQLEWYRDKIMYIFGNTKSSMGILEDVNRSTNESAVVQWQRGTVKPDMEAIVNTLNEFLVPEFGDNLVIGFVDPVPEDTADDVKEAQALYPLGVITLDEARELVGLDPVEDGTGGEFYQPPAPIVSDPSQNGDSNSANKKPKNPKPDESGNE